MILIYGGVGLKPYPVGVELYSCSPPRLKRYYGRKTTKTHPKPLYARRNPFDHTHHTHPSPDHTHTP
eukprot:5202085-Prymnesium_polylepis.1